MEPLTWRKEGISNHWAGPRGFRKSCCKVTPISKFLTEMHSMGTLDSGRKLRNY